MYIKVLLLLLVAASTVYGQSIEIPTLDPVSKVLHIPVLKYQVGDTTLYVRADLQGTSDYNSFRLISATKLASGLPISNITLSGVGGAYTGVLGLYRPGTKTEVAPFSSCPDAPFNPGSADLEVRTTTQHVELQINLFPNLRCELEGDVADGKIGGAFQCSDFNDGQWSASLFQPTMSNTGLLVDIALVGDKCSFDTSFSGLRN